MQLNYENILNTLKETVTDLWSNHHYSNEGMKKGEMDIVTETDLKFEKAILSKLKEIAPDIKILSEETLSDTSTDGTFFTVDPVDGTWNYAYDIGIYGTQIALVENGEPTLGLVYLPVFNKMFTAYKGGGAYLNGKQIHVKDIDHNRAMIGLADFRRDGIDKLAKLAEQIVKHFGKFRITGASCFGYSMVSCGSYQGRISVKPKLWDIAPGIILVNEAGGAAKFNNDYSIVAASKETLEEIEKCYKHVYK